LKIRNVGPYIINQFKSAVRVRSGRNKHLENLLTSQLSLTLFRPTLHCYPIRVGLGIPQITQVRPWVSHRAAWARIFSTIPNSANPTSGGRLGIRWKGIRAEEVGWFVLSLVQPFLCLFDAKTTTVEQISLFKLICSKNDGLLYLIILPVG